MSAGLKLDVFVKVVGDYTNSAGVAALDAKISEELLVEFLTGSGLDQASKVYTEALSIAASSSETLDLTTLTDPLGAALSFGAVKAVVILADATNANTILVGNAASNQWAAPFDAATDVVKVMPGGALVLLNPTAAGWTVDSTHKSLKLANSAGGSVVTGSLVVIGI